MSYIVNNLKMRLNIIKILVLKVENFEKERMAEAGMKQMPK